MAAGRATSPSILSPPKQSKPEVQSIGTYEPKNRMKTAGAAAFPETVPETAQKSDL
jgi:hypothetical protein